MTGAKRPFVIRGTLAEVSAVQRAEVDAAGTDHGHGADEGLDGERAAEIEVVRESQVDEEVAVGVDVEHDHGQGDRGRAEFELPHRVRQLELGVEDADFVRDLSVQNLELEAGEALGPLAGQLQAQAIQNRIVEDHAEIERVEHRKARSDQPARRCIEPERQMVHRIRVGGQILVRIHEPVDDALHRGQRIRFAQRDVLTQPQILELEGFRLTARDRRRRLRQQIPGKRVVGEVVHLVEKAAVELQVY